jgi:hypothetical protein
MERDRFSVKNHRLEPDAADSQARVHADLAALTSILSIKAHESEDLGVVERRIQAANWAKLNGRFRKLCDTHLPVWLYFRNPAAALWFYVKQRQAKQTKNPSWGQVHSLDLSLCRAQFSRVIARTQREQLRKLIDRNEISAWSALSLVRSTGCKTNKSGHIVPNAIGILGLFVGFAACLVLGLILFVLLAQIGIQMSAVCTNYCAVQGLIMLSLWTVMFLIVASSVSWGRYRSAAQIQVVLDRLQDGRWPLH